MPCDRAHRAGPPAPERNDGISIKLSALFSRYGWRSASASSPSCCRACGTLVDAAARADLNLTIDAEEKRPARTVARRLRGAGRRIARCIEMAVSASPSGLPDARSPWSRRWRASRAAQPALHGAPRRGAYWDGEVKRAPGARPGGLSGVHAQAPHRHRLPRLRARCSRSTDRSIRSSPPTTPAPSPPSCRWPRAAAASRCSACTAWARACTAS